MSLDLVVVGNLLLDDVVFADGRTRMAQPGGAALYGALAAALWDIEIGIVTRLGSDYPRSILEALGDRGIHLEGVRDLGGPSLRTWLLYEGRRRRVVHRLDGPTHGEVSPAPDEIPRDWSALAFHLAPMPFAVQQDLVATLTLRDGVLLSLDPYKLLTSEAVPSWRDLLTNVELFFLSEDEMEIHRRPEGVFAELAPEPSARATRLRWVAFKQGARGGLLYEIPTAKSTRWPPRAQTLVDPTGAGDAFAAGVLAGHLLGESIPRALRQGVVAASFALEGHGPDGLLDATPERATKRLREWFDGDVCDEFG
jgi:sugar/nucleoside kinase (ribokinase family)